MEALGTAREMTHSGLRLGKRGQLNQGHLTTFSNQPQFLNPHNPLHFRKLLRKL